MVAERPRWSRRKEAGGSGTSEIRVPTPPAPPPGSAATENPPIPPPGSTGAEQERRHEAQEEPSSPTQVPSDEGATH
eukprot:4762124-Pyramimonas_sp.AAC.1